MGAPFLDLLIQAPVLFGQAFELTLLSFGDWPQGNIPSQLLFQSLNMLVDGIRILGLGTQPEVLLVVVNRRRWVGLALLEQAGKLEMGRCRPRVDL